MEYQDKDYWQKRSILRNWYSSNQKAHTTIKYLAFLVHDKLTNPIIDYFLDYDVIVDFLVGGFLAFAKEGGTYFQKDVTNLILTVDATGAVIWEEWIWKDCIATYKKNNMIYISYYKSEISFADSLYRGLIDPDNKEFILRHVDYVVDALTRPFLDIDGVLKIDEKVKRVYKLEKIYDKVRQG